VKSGASAPTGTVSLSTGIVLAAFYGADTDPSKRNARAILNALGRLSMRIIIFTGHGGSGVSTLAAATASAIAHGGTPTLAFGVTRGLGAAFQAAIGVDARIVTDNLDAAEGHGGYSGPDEFRDWLEALLEWRSMDPDLAGDLAGLPGVNHIGRLLELEHLIDSSRYQAVVVDAAALSSFLDFPAALDAAARWLDRLFSRRQQTMFEPFLRAFAADYANAGEDVFETGRELLTRLADLRDTLSDPETTSVRVVVNPTEHASSDAREAISVLTLFGYRVDAVVANRILPEEVTDPFFAAARTEHRTAIDDLAEISDVRHLRVELLSAPPRSAGLLDFSLLAYGDAVPIDFLAPLKEHSVEPEGDNYVLKVVMPYARREDLRLEEMDEGIAVHLNGRRCVLDLPADVAYRQASSWAYEDDVLRVVLER
jgi:arsenite-transporting ATPase